MPFKPLVTAGIESLLNTFLYRSPALSVMRIPTSVACVHGLQESQPVRA